MLCLLNIQISRKKRKWAKKCCSKGYSHFGLHRAHYVEKFQDVKPGSKFYGSVNSKRIHHPRAFVTGRLLGYEFPRKGIFLQRAVVQLNFMVFSTIFKGKYLSMVQKENNKLSRAYLKRKIQNLDFIKMVLFLPTPASSTRTNTAGVDDLVEKAMENFGKLCN